jgi:hypothetical protein
MKCSLLLAALFLVGVSAVAQQGGSIDPQAVPVEQEPRHRLVFANDYVRVLDAFLPPLYVSQNHTHTYDNVAVTILPGVEGAQGQTRIGFAGFSRGGYSHVITNPNTAPMRFIAVELRAPDHGGEAEDTPQANHLTMLSNDRVRITRVRLDAGQTIPLHTHASGYVSVVVRGGEGAGTWKWHPANEPATTLDAGKQSLELVEIEGK